jgi:MFS family permease
MKLRRRIPTNQLIDDAGGLVRPGWLLTGLCLAGAAKAIEPPFEVFYPPAAVPFGAGWSLANFLSSSQAVILVLFILAGGALGDLYGRRKVLLWGIVIMLAANVLLLLNSNTLWHVIWRTIALFSAGTVLPLALAPIYVFFEGRQRAVAFAIFLSVISVAGLLSGYQGRIFSQLLDLRGSYLLPGLLSVMALIIVSRSLPESRAADPRLMDVIIHSGWTVLVLAIIYTVFEIGLGGAWLMVVLLVSVLVTVIGLTLVIWWKRKTHGELTRTAVINTRHVTVLIISGAIIQIAFLSVYTLAYDYYRVGQNLNFSQTLLSLSPMLLGMLTAILLIARLWAYREVRQVVATGFLIVSVAIVALAFTARLPYWMQVLPLAAFGISIVSTKTVWTNAFFQTLIDRYVGLNAGINSATLLVGSAMGAFLSTQLLAFFGKSAFVRQAASLRLSEGALGELFNEISVSVAAGEQAGLENLALMVSDSLYSKYQDAYISGFALSLLVIALLCFVIVVLIYMGIRHTLKFRPEDTPLRDDESI